MSSLNDLITRSYNNFRGVDFTNNNVVLSRSPGALNMWKSYKNSTCIETRPGMKLLNNFGNKVLGLFFYCINDIEHVLVHIGPKLLKWTNYPNIPAQTVELYTNMNMSESRSFVFDNVLFIMDGINYLEFNGETLKKVEGTIPMTSYYKNPDGSTSIDETTDTDLVYQPVNCLTPLRKNAFFGDGTSSKYYLDAQDLDVPSKYLMEASVNNIKLIENIDFTVDREKGIVTFNEIPEKDSEVIITYSKTGNDYENRILNCTLLCEFDNRIFFSGNPNYPNSVLDRKSVV